MPELPDIEAYRLALTDRIGGRALAGIRFFLVFHRP